MTAKTQRRSARKPPAVDLQVTGADGVIYRIPAAELPQYATSPREQTFGVPLDGRIETTDFAGMVVPGGPSDGMVAMPPTMLARLVRVAVELGFGKQLEEALGGTTQQISLPTSTVRDLQQNVGNGRRSRGAAARLEPGDGQFTRTTLVELGRAVASAVETGRFEKALAAFRPLDAQFNLALTADVSRNVKLVLHDVSRTATLSRIQRGVIGGILFSDCSCSPPSPPKPPPKPSCAETADTGILGCPQ